MRRSSWGRSKREKAARRRRRGPPPSPRLRVVRTASGRECPPSVCSGSRSGNQAESTREEGRRAQGGERRRAQGGGRRRAQDGLPLPPLPPGLPLPLLPPGLPLPSPPPTAKSRGASRWKGQASGTRASTTQLPRERDPHKAPKLGIPPGAVSPAMCRRLSGHAILCSQGKWGRGGVPSADALGSLCPVRGCVEPSITLSEAACRWRHVRVLEVKIYYFFISVLTEITFIRHYIRL